VVKLLYRDEIFLDLQNMVFLNLHFFDRVIPMSLLVVTLINSGIIPPSQLLQKLEIVEKEAILIKQLLCYFDAGVSHSLQMAPWK
jgi:hypothetical protein